MKKKIKHAIIFVMALIAWGVLIHVVKIKYIEYQKNIIVKQRNAEIERNVEIKRKKIVAVAIEEKKKIAIEEKKKIVLNDIEIYTKSPFFKQSEYNLKDTKIMIKIRNKGEFKEIFRIKAVVYDKSGNVQGIKKSSISNFASNELDEMSIIIENVFCEDISYIKFYYREEYFLKEKYIGKYNIYGYKYSQ